MITVTTSFLGLDVSALCYRDPRYGWLIDDCRVMANGIDIYEHLNKAAQQNLTDHVRNEAANMDYKWL